jgi:hypothetical protein
MARGAGGRTEPGPLPQPAAASITAAASAAHLAQRLKSRSPDAGRAERTPAMMTTFYRTPMANCRARHIRPDHRLA